VPRPEHPATERELYCTLVSYFSGKSPSKCYELLTPIQMGENGPTVTQEKMADEYGPENIQATRDSTEEIAARLMALEESRPPT
jgi:hypothetical protein